ncbi:hypothetical protein FH609_022680 [Streptomyces sp. 3MP-14]|uniref:Uncharacterized protein n=1 Tax=Streptomyces mimosae TaxID=2586635 RepID=A0A5N6A1D6_9ACTN|nr:MULTISPECIES: hypothetical protein [Streptomyces]KAB8162574.1 hypothetical protein FH607_021270 [Streptomyces mimosae]KAB8174401.1 hypothetical protein FH609_022680 [Streptomyces sp. 3MP-14]
MAHITGEHAPESVRPSPRPTADPRPPEAAPDEAAEAPPEPGGCLFAVSQPPLMLFLTVIGTLLLIAGLHDQFWL